MGDMADWLTENGELEQIAHLEGDCDMGCRLCFPEKPPRKQRKKKKLRSPSGGGPQTGGETA
jgi:hypothetical protein